MPDTASHSQIQCNPIVINDVMYFTSPRMKLFALDAETGKQEWMLLPYDSITGNKGGHFNLNNNRWRRLENKLRICTKSFWMVVY